MLWDGVSCAHANLRVIANTCVSVGDCCELGPGAALLPDGHDQQVSAVIWDFVGIDVALA